MSNDYDIVAIRDLLKAAFTPAELRRLFLYTQNPDLHSLADEISPELGESLMMDQVITFCRRRALLADLLAEVEKARPRQYERFAPRLVAAVPSPDEPATRPAAGYAPATERRAGCLGRLGQVTLRVEVWRAVSVAAVVLVFGVALATAGRSFWPYIGPVTRTPLATPDPEPTTTPTPTVAIPQAEELAALEPAVFASAVRDEMVRHRPQLRLYYRPPSTIASEVASPGSDEDPGYRLTYAQVTETEYACWAIHLENEMDVSDLAQLAFDVKGAQGGETPHVWLQSCSPAGDVRNAAVMDPGAALDASQRVAIPVTAGWQRLALPLSDFRVQGGEAQTLKLACIQEISFCFEWGQMTGTVFVDGIAFEAD